MRKDLIFTGRSDFGPVSIEVKVFADITDPSVLEMGTLTVTDSAGNTYTTIHPVPVKVQDEKCK